MPSTIIRHSSAQGTSTVKASKTFTGDVWVDAIHMAPDASMAHVMFTPCARTYWHTHEHGQLLRVMAGSGWICDKGGIPQRLNVGDTVWAAAGTTHWHGADDGSYMMHLALGLGKTEWLEEVTEAEYLAKN
jgi:quercetin dioxygenase-like cupin family protein